MSKRVIHDIKTEILCKTCFGHNSTHNERKPSIFGRIFIDFCVNCKSAIKTRFEALLKIACNLGLITDSQCTENYVEIPLKIVDFRSFCVELWPKQVLHRISVPMSYIWLVYWYFAGGIRRPWGSLCGPVEKGASGNHWGRNTQRRLEELSRNPTSEA